MRLPHLNGNAHLQAVGLWRLMAAEPRSLSSDVATVLELSAPDKMRVLNAGSDIERKIYQSMSWEERGGKYYGHGILREGALILSVSEVLTDTGSTSTATILGHEEPVWAGGSDCVRVDQQSSLQATAQKPKKKQDDSFLDAISKRDAITGKRSLNIRVKLRPTTRAGRLFEISSMVTSNRVTSYLNRVMLILTG